MFSLTETYIRFDCDFKKSKISMENQEFLTGYKWEVLKKLKERNENERKDYGEILQITYNQYEQLSVLRLENRKLVNSNEKLQSNIELASLKSGMKTALKNLRKQNREFSQQLVNLRATMDKKEKEIKDKTTEIEVLKTSLTGMENQYQFIKEEFEALQITYSKIVLSITEKKMQKVDSSLQLETEDDTTPTEDVEPMNQENEELLTRERDVELSSVVDEIAEEVSDDALPNDTCTVNTTKVQGYISLESFSSTNGQYEFVAEESEVNAVAWTHSLCKFATAGGDRIVRMWDFSSGQGFLKESVHKSYSPIYSVDFNPEETLMLTASCDGANRLWTTSDMKIQDTLSGHSKGVMSAKFLGSRGKVVSGSRDKTLKIWDLQRRECIETMSSDSIVHDVAISYGYECNIVSGHYDKKLRFWDLRCNSKTTAEISLLGRVTSLDFSSDGYSLLSSVRAYDCLQLVDIRKNGVVCNFECDKFRIGRDWARAKLSPDGQFCACGSLDGHVYIWVVSTGVLKNVLKEHSSTVTACAWSWCGNYLLSCDKNGNAILRLEF